MIVLLLFCYCINGRVYYWREGGREGGREGVYVCVRIRYSVAQILILVPIISIFLRLCKLVILVSSAVHRSRSFNLFCRSWSRSLFTSGKTPEALVCAANYNHTSAKEFMIDNYGILCCFVYHCGVSKTVGRILIISENFEFSQIY